MAQSRHFWATTIDEGYVAKLYCQLCTAEWQGVKSTSGGWVFRFHNCWWGGWSLGTGWVVVSFQYSYTYLALTRILTDCNWLQLTVTCYNWLSLHTQPFTTIVCSCGHSCTKSGFCTTSHGCSWSKNSKKCDSMQLLNTSCPYHGSALLADGTISGSIPAHLASNMPSCLAVSIPTHQALSTPSVPEFDLHQHHWLLIDCFQPSMWQIANHTISQTFPTYP